MDEESIFAAAIALEPTEARAAFLDEACGGDQQLRSRVEALINSHENAGSFLHESAAPASPTIDQAPLERPGTQIGPYRLLEKLGEGGMGVVFLAEQKEPVERQVALKIIRPGMDSERVIERFEAERQALAVMDHPNVAKVLDAGSTDSGRPYFVMELVRGTRITQYCDEHQLSVRERLELFIPVCQAVQHAHQKGIIHRDIKPSNILVAEFDGRPVPKVIDFGVAKAMDQGAAQKQLSTQYGQIVGTLEYMSPEQARLSSHDIDTRSDVYSLGAVLYELLTGITPFDKHKLYSAAFDQALHMIEAEEPPKPSLRLSSSDSLPSVAALRDIDPQRLTGLIRGELDWIVMKALEKERARRYDSAASLAQDIDHYLHDQPVLAGPPSRAYRFHKFARRNKSILATTAMVAVALVVGTGVATWQAMRAHAQATRAEDEKARAQATLHTAIRAVDEMYSEVAEKRLSAYPLAEPMKLQFLEGATRFYTSLSAINASDSELRFERAKAFSRLGRCQRWLGHNSEAESAQRTAIQELEQVTSETPTAPKCRVELAIAYVDLGLQLWDRTKGPETDRLFERALTMLQALDENVAQDPEYEFRVAWAYNVIAWYHKQLKHYGTAESLYRQAIARGERRAAILPDDAPLQFELAQTYGGLAIVLTDIDRSEEARRYHEKELHLQEQVVIHPPVDPYHRLHLSYSYKDYGRFLEHLGLSKEAEEQYRKSLRVAVELASDFPHVPEYHNAWRASYLYLGEILRHTSRPSDADAVYREVIGLAQRLAAQWPTIPAFQLQLCTVHVDLGDLLLRGDRMAEAEQQFQEAVLLGEKLVAVTPDDRERRRALARAKNSLGLVFQSTNRLPEAEQLHRQAMSIDVVLADDCPAVSIYRLELSFCHELLARVMCATGRPDEAEQNFRKGLALQEALAAEDFDLYAKYLAFTYAEFGDLLRDKNRHDEAVQLYRQAVTLFERLLAAYPARSTFRDAMVSILSSMILVAETWSSQGHREQAEKLLGEVVEVSRRTLEPARAAELLQRIELLRRTKMLPSIEECGEGSDGTSNSRSSEVKAVPDASNLEKKWRQEREAKTSAAEPPPAAEEPAKKPQADEGG